MFLFLRGRFRADRDSGRTKSAGRVGRSGRIERHKANDRLTPAPHQTVQAVFPHTAFRIPFFILLSDSDVSTGQLVASDRVRIVHARLLDQSNGDAHA